MSQNAVMPRWSLGNLTFQKEQCITSQKCEWVKDATVWVQNGPVNFKSLLLPGKAAPVSTCTCTHTQVPSEARRGRWIPWVRVTEIVSCPVWLLGTGELNSEPLQEQRVFLNIQPSFQPLGLENFDAAKHILSSILEGFYIMTNLSNLWFDYFRCHIKYKYLQLP